MPRNPQNCSPQKVLNTLKPNEMRVDRATSVSILAERCTSWRHALALNWRPQYTIFNKAMMRSTWLAASREPTLTHPIDTDMVRSANSHDSIIRRFSCR